MLFFTSDEHYGHENIIRYVNRPFKNSYEQTEKLISNFNSKVSQNDHTWHLGDFLWHRLSLKEALDIFFRLNGTHSLTWGNHDQLIEREPLLKSKFSEIADIKVLSVSSRQKLVLCHYGMRVWPHSHRGAWHLYGHSHDELAPAGLSFDVGVDSKETNFFPLSLDEVADNMSRRTCNHIIGKKWEGKEEPVLENS